MKFTEKEKELLVKEIMEGFNKDTSSTEIIIKFYETMLTKYSNRIDELEEELRNVKKIT